LKSIQKTLEESIFEKNQLLKSMATLFKSNSMGSMVSSLAHEINGPLGSISINSELLKLELKEKIEQLNVSDFDHFKHMVEQIFEATKKAGLVVTRLRSLFTHGEDKFELFNLSVTLDDIYSLMSSEFMNEKITFNLQIENNLMVYGDVSQIQMVVINTLKNSMEALKNISDQKIINLHALATNGQTRLEIADNGPGFNDSILKNGFELFKTSKPNGMGVGMWLSRAIMENHNGSINATNGSKGGANITLIFYDKKNDNQGGRRQGVNPHHKI
ncbi:MAG: HAMP domain-containing sensor histidine kinase, partial [Polynucleobacter sp.]